MAASPVSARAYWNLIHSNRNYRRLWLAQIVSEIGDWLYVVAIYALLLRLTGTAKSVALAFVLQVLPQAIVAPAAGILNDRISRKRVMISADLVRAFIVLMMLFAARLESVTLIYTLLFLETVMWAFFEPGRNAVVPNITTRDELMCANALSSMTWSVNLAIGSGVGGAIAAFLGNNTVFVLDSLSFLASAALLRGMDFAEPHVRSAGPFRPRDLADFTPVAEGVRYVAKDKRLLSLLFAKAGIGLLAPHWVLLPIYGERLFPVRSGGIDPQRGAMLAMSILMACRGVGAMLGPYFGGLWAGQSHSRLRWGIFFGFLLGCCGYLGLSWAPLLVFAALAMIVANSGSSLGWVFSTTLLQHYTEDRFRGRVFSADTAFLITSMSASTYLAGVLIDAGAAARAVALGTGLVALIPAVLWSAGVKRFWKAEKQPVVDGMNRGL